MEECPTLDEVLKTPKRLWSALGGGSQGSVYKIGNYVVKIINLKDERARRAFQLEKRMFEELAENPRTKSVVPKLCSIEESQSAGAYRGYILQKYEEVMNLRDYMEHLTATKTLWNFENAKQYITHLIEALLYLHINGYVHRDIKPENILIRTEGEINRPILIDFGLTCKLPCEGVELGGTPMYMPQYLLPPQMRSIRNPFKVKTGRLNMKVKKVYDQYALWLTIEELMPFIDFTSGTEEQVTEKMKFKAILEKNIKSSKDAIFRNSLKLKLNSITTMNTRRRLENLNTSVRNKLLKQNAGSRKLKRKTRKSTY